MPPKAKAKAKAKADGGSDAPKMDVPRPPPAPVCLPLPGPLAAKHAADRKLLLAWADPLGQYRLQMLPYTPGVNLSEEEEAGGWTDVDHAERVPLPGRPVHEAWLVPCEHVRLRYRLRAIPPAKPIDGKYAASWASAPSEPVASCVDLPVRLKAEQVFDDSMPFVALSWESANMEWLRQLMDGGGGEAPVSNPFEALPGLLPVKAQVRWRLMRKLRSDGSLPSELPTDVVSPAVDGLSCGSGSFRFEDGVWRLDYRDALQGVAARFSVRVGTCYRWSPWSEWTAEVEVEVPEPSCPGAEVGERSPEISLRSLGDREVEIAWPPFGTEGILSKVEYRVMVCVVQGPTDDAPAWDAHGFVAVILHEAWSSNELSTVVRGLHPNTWYMIRIDTRHCFVGKRTYSASKAFSAPFRTTFPRSPPLQPMPVAEGGHLFPDRFVQPSQKDAANLMLGVSEEDVSKRPCKAPYDWSSWPWVALRVERSYLSEYTIEYKDAFAAGEEAGAEYYQGWQRPEALEVADDGGAAEGGHDDGWQVVRVGLGASAPESVVCRLVNKVPLVDISPMRWSVATQPLVPFLAPVSFSMPSVWGQVSDGSFRLALRFFLQPAPTQPGEHAEPLAQAPPLAAPPAPLPGHRFASRYQLRLRPGREREEGRSPRSESNGTSCRRARTMPAEKTADGALVLQQHREDAVTAVPSPQPWQEWTELAPQLLPQPCIPRGVDGSGPAPDVDLGALARSSPDAQATLADLTARLGWRGARYEVELDPAASELLPLRRRLAHGEPLELEVRVGSEHRWSAWASPGQAPFRLLAPAPLPALEGQFDCEAISATQLSLSWEPFERLPGVTRVEYVVRAVPEFDDAGGEGDDTSAEGAGAVEVVVEEAHAARQTLEELLQTREARRFLDGTTAVELPRLLDTARATAGREREADRDPGSAVRADICGLLPCTRYAVTVRARYPAARAAGLRGGADACLSAVVVTPGGAAQPAAPLAVPLDSAPGEEAAGSAGCGAREALLVVERFSDYTLEYRAAGPEAANFGALGATERSRFGGSWEASETPWHQAAFEDDAAGGEDLDGTSRQVRVALPSFESEEPLPDVVEFRLRALALSEAHPCRWTGGISEPVAVCIAPPHRPPRLRHVLADDRWSARVSLDLFKAAPPPAPPVPLGQSLQAVDDDTGSNREDHDRDMQELRRDHAVPVPPRESWQENAELRLVPVGYGHRMVTMAQLRYSIQSSLVPAQRKRIEDKIISKKWQTSSVVPVSSENLDGSCCTFEMNSDAGPVQGGIYMFQVRVGDGCRWSAWSPTSVAFGWRVPPPAPPVATRVGAPAQVAVEIVSSSSARLRWGDFTPAPGLTLLEYELQAVPQLKATGGADSASMASTAFQHRHRGGIVQHDITGLIPFRTYVFSVQARYPEVGDKTWTGRLESAPVTLEHTEVIPDPPAPRLVAGAEDAGSEADEGAFAVLDYPGEECGVRYDLQYAPAVGPEAEAELRTSQDPWRAPPSLLALECDGAAARAGKEPRWRARLPDPRCLQGGPLQAALLQQVRFRLRAQDAEGAPSERRWSSPSAPASVGIAPPDAVTSTVAVAGQRLVLQVQLSLDLRLAGLLAAAGAAELARARAELREALRQGPGQALEDGAAPGSAHEPPLLAWPRGFGHAFVTRCQLRLRRSAARAQGAGPAGEGAEDWNPWFHCPDTPLPKEVDRDHLELLLASGTRNAHARWFSMEALQPPGQALAAGDVVQVAARVGDGVQWSAWKSSKELAVAVAAPRRAQDGDAAEACWAEDACTVRWPAAAAAPGLDAVEYLVEAHPDSDAMQVHIAAVLDGPAAAASDGHRPMLARALGVAGRGAPLAEGGGRHASVEVAGLCKDVRYSFVVLARYPAVGSREFTRLFQTGPVAWRSPVPSAEPAQADGPPIPPPAVERVATPGDGKRLSRWEMEGEGRLVLLRWPGLLAPAEGGGPPQYEVQASRECASALGRRARPVAEPWATGREWVQCDPTFVTLDGVPCAALWRLPFPVGRFRLFDAAARRAGPASEPIPAAYERLQAPPAASMVALGRGVPRALGVELRFALGAGLEAARWATRGQVRFRALGAGGTAGAWEQADAVPLGVARAADGAAAEATVLVREEDGLELGSAYEFGVRLGDGYRLGPWSEASAPLPFAISPPCPGQGAGIRVQARETTAVLSWEAFEPDAELAERLPSFGQLPVKYTVSVYDGQTLELVTRLDVAGGAACQGQGGSVEVHSLAPGTSYSASLAATWARFGGGSAASREPGASGQAGGRPLLAAFATLPPSARPASGGAGRPRSARGVSGAPAEGGVDLPPGSPRGLREARKPGASGPEARPSGAPAAGATAAPYPAAAPARPGQQLPRLVPMPPPKFEARDPISMAAVSAPLADKPSYARTPRARALTRALGAASPSWGGE